ncbi:MAG TPA: M14 family metallopeptidase [Herpetosiphonaceae bacterium]
MRLSIKPLRRFGTLLFVALMGAALLLPGMQSGTQRALAATPDDLDRVEPAVVARITLPDRAALDALVATGADLAEYLHQSSSGLDVDVIATPAEIEALRQQGFNVTNTLLTEADWAARVAEREAAVAAEEAALASVDTLTILRADYFQNDAGSFLSVEAKTSAGAAATVRLTAAWDAGSGTAPDAGGTATMSRFTDAGVYMYHRLLVPVGSRPAKVQITSTQGGAATAAVREWLDSGRPGNPKHHYVKDFISHYMHPTEVYERIEALAREFPDLAEVIELPNKTNGYRRKAQATMGSLTSNAVVISSKAWGHEGGTAITVEFANPGAPNQPLAVNVNGSAISVRLATNASGALASTAAQVAAALNAQAGALVTAHTYRGNAGAGVVQPVAATPLRDFLSAPAEISRDPFTVRAIRIGKHRDGSRIGVLAYSQEHAREWVTPLVAVETAERLLRNYARDGETRQLLDNLDIFIIPSVNPDGAHYSFFDYNMQRKNMFNYCGPQDADPGRRNEWGVDNNRNYGIGSLFDGYSGASTNCRSGTYAGPEELSEPESRNVIWVAEQHPNIKFSMNIHSYGGYFMWAPGAYRLPGRETLDRAALGQEAFFWASSEQILASIKEHRGTVILPGRTGPTADVLYSAAGNSADHLWYGSNIFAWNFEVGADRWDAERSRWEPVGFQPSFAEGHGEAMEFANGLIAMLKVAKDYGKDAQPPRSWSVPGQGKYSGPVALRFETSEPATIYYTLDGSRPTFRSQKYSASGMREGPQVLTLTETTTLRWFAVDAAGNIENGYDPYRGENYRQVRIEIKP